MFGFIFGAVVGVASYWAYQRYIVGSDDDAFADFDTGTIDRPTASEVHGRPSETVPGYSDPAAGSANPSA
ncbi:MAG: hypothetical protein IT306_04345 [Chloroflexi bacterium]|nr:hypothetical protein [Chloroflexota bacterium]